MKHWLRTMVMGLLTCLSSACMVLAPLGSDPAQWQAQLKPGDTVQVTLRDGSQKEFKLGAIESDALSGSGQRFAFADISQLARKQMDGTRTTLLVVGLVAAAAAASSGGGGGSGGGGDY